MTITFTYADLAWAGVFTATLVVISIWRDYRIAREHVISVIKMIVQLFIMAFFLIYLLQIEAWNFTVGMIITWIVVGVMLINATIVTGSRGKGVPHIYAIVFSGIFCGSFFIIILFLLTGTTEYSVIGLIPFAGSMVGNTLTKNTQGIERFLAEFHARVPEIETVLALGGTTRQATTVVERKTVVSLILPTNDSMRNAGFFLPGASIGLLMTGTPPLEAMIFQCILFMAWSGATIISGSIITNLMIKQFMTPNNQIRYEILNSLLDLQEKEEQDSTKKSLKILLKLKKAPVGEQ